MPIPARREMSRDQLEHLEQDEYLITAFGRQALGA